MKLSGRFAGYDANYFRRDLISGLIVGIIAIPLGMAFAISSGVKPEYGLYTTIIAGFLISLFGGSRFQIGGPTGAFVPVLFAIVMQYGYENLLIAGMLAGIILVLMGLFKLGTLITFIPRPVIVGFTSGIAVIIFSGQIANFLGLENIQQHKYFLANMKEIGLHLSTVNVYSMIAAFICFAAIMLTNKYFAKIPGSLVGLIISTLVAVTLWDGQLATIGSTYGAVSNELPSFHMPAITMERIMQLIEPALVIAILGGIESLLSAVVADAMTGDRHNSNRELVGQGIANIVTPLFGGIPATGAIARTATNIKNGAASPVSGIVHSIVVLLVLLLFAPLTSSIPLASMAPILMVVAWNMSERKAFYHILKTRTTDSIVLLITFSLTVLTDLTLAVEVGLGLAVILFVKRMSDVMRVAKVLPDHSVKHDKMSAQVISKQHDCPQVSICTVEGALFFGAANTFEQAVTSAVHRDSNVLLLRMSKVPFMDTSGEANLAHVVRDVQKRDGVVLISGIQDQPLQMLERTGLDQRIGKEHFFAHTGEAIDYALTRLDRQKCIGCKHFAFRECDTLSDPACEQRDS